MADIGSKYHIGVQLVSRICRDYKTGGAKIAQKRLNEADAKQTREDIEDVVC